MSAKPRIMIQLHPGQIAWLDRQGKSRSKTLEALIQRAMEAERPRENIRLRELARRVNEGN